MACQERQAEQIKTQIKQKYEYLSWDEIDTCFNLALHDFVRISFPSESNRPSPEKLNIDFMASQWIFARMVDILSREGATNVTSYKENGISFTFASSYVDPNLVAMIMPKGGVPR